MAAVPQPAPYSIMPRYVPTTGLGQPARSFWQLPPGTPDWMRPPDWMALGNPGLQLPRHNGSSNGLGMPGKIVGTMWEPKLKQYVPVYAAAGLGSPGKIVGYDPETGQWFYAAAGVGQTDLSRMWPVVALVAGVGALVYVIFKAEQAEYWTR